MTRHFSENLVNRVTVVYLAIFRSVVLLLFPQGCDAYRIACETIATVVAGAGDQSSLKPLGWSSVLDFSNSHQPKAPPLQKGTGGGFHETF